MWGQEKNAWFLDPYFFSRFFENFVRSLFNLPTHSPKSNAMRNLIYAINLTIDGCFDHTNMAPDEELFDFFINLVRGTDTLVYGRITYQLMVPYWPDTLKDPSSSKAEIEFARAFDAAEKVVFSKSLERVEDKNSRLVRTNAAEEILRMKLQPGKD